jgi:dihydrofolate synthase / folylpolyglutamate synthase
MAFEHFARVRPDMAVLEVGMGGRLDATNVVEPRVSIIADISLDHQKYLGTTVGEIAREKVGIIRPGGVVVTLPQSPEANAVIGNTILDLGARSVSAVPYVPPVSPGSSPGFAAEEKSAKPRSRYPLHVLGQEIMVESPLVGRHQLRNIALAIAAAEELHNQGFNQITPPAIEGGIRATHWPGRFQVLPAEDCEPEYVFDVAHNPAGAWALRSTLSMVYGDRPITMVFGVMRDKSVSEIAEILFPIAEHVVATHADNPRSATPDEIRQAASRVATDIQEADNVASALEKARRAAGPSGLAVITGSIYIVGEAMRVLGVRI